MTDGDRPLRIVRLEAENVKRLRAVAVEPDGSLVVVGGRNGQGKSSLLDAIMYALGGQSAVCERPLRDGTSRGRVTVDLGDLVVKRTFTAGGGGTLTVLGKDGAPLRSPQAILDRLVGRLTFDPLAFSKMEPKRQLETLRELVGVDFADLDDRRAAIYAERTAVGREVRQVEAQLGAMPLWSDAPKEDVSIPGLLAELAAIEKARREADAAHVAANAMRANARAEIEAGEALDREIAALERRLVDLREERICLAAGAASATREADEAAVRARELEAAVPDDGPIRAAIAGAEEVNAKRRANDARALVFERLEGLSSRYDAMTAEIAEIDAEKAKAIAALKFPVPGLSFGEDGVLFGGVPFEQASSAEQIRVSVAMGLAMHPRLRVLLIRDGSLLDMDSLAMVAEMAAEADAQVWLERVGDGEECSLVIEDGAVVQPMGGDDVTAPMLTDATM